MRVFGFDTSEWRERYARDEWVHIKGGIDPDFLSELRDFVSGRFETHHVSGRGIGGTKEQAVFEFPEAIDFPDELFDVVADVAGLRRETMTLSERHIKAYDADAPADPPAHKDRLSSQVSVGLSIESPDDSHLVLYPHGHREPNPFNVSAALRESLTEEELPENLLRGAQGLVIDDRPGDVTMFAGSSMWHKRRNAAGAVNLYLKFNDFGSDPLGEDPDTDRLRQATLTALRDGDLSGLLLLPARRLDVITRQLTREPGVEILQAEVWDAGPVRLSEDDVALLRSLDGRRTVGQVMDAAAGRAAAAVEADVRHLAERGVVDLVAS